MKKIFSILSLAVLLAFPSAYQSLTSQVNDYTNGKNGTLSRTYDFTIDGKKKNAIGKSANTTDMSVEQWVNINASGFNDMGLSVVSTSGTSNPSTTAYTLAFASNGGTTVNNIISYANTNVSLPRTTQNGYAFTGWTKLENGSPTNFLGAAGTSYTLRSDTTAIAGWEVKDIHSFVDDITINPTSYTYSGSNSKPTVNLVLKNGVSLTKGTDYDIEYRALRTITANTIDRKQSATNIAGYTKGEASGTCNADCSVPCVSLEHPETAPHCYWYTKTISTQKDVWSACTGSCEITDVGTYQAVLVGKGEYSSEISKTYSIGKASVRDGNVKVTSIEKQTWNGSPITPKPVITYNGKTLTEGKDYTVSYSNNTAVGTATMKITGIGNFTGERNISFQINPRIFNLTVKNGTYVYDGKDISSKITNETAPRVISDPADATIKYGKTSGNYTSNSIPTDYTKAGTYTVYWQVSKTGYRTETGTLTITIVKQDNNITTYSDSGRTKVSNTVVFQYPNNGELYFKLDFGATVTVSSSDLVTGGVDGNKITFIPKKTGSGTVTLNVAETGNTKASSTKVYVTVNPGEILVTAYDKTVEYNYKNHSPNIPAISGTTTNYSWVENGQTKNSTTLPSFKNAGVYPVSFVVSKQFYESKKGLVTLTITPKSLVGFDYYWPNLRFVYDGSVKKPAPVIKDLANNYTLKEGVDYVLSYKDNILPNSDTNHPTVTVEGIGNYAGTVNKSFTIEKGTIVYTINNGRGQYTGYEQNGSITKAGVEVTAPAGYDLQYSVGTPVCEVGRPGCSEDEKVYDSGYNVPKFKNIGTYTINFRIKAKGYQTVLGQLTLTIEKAKLEKPTLFQNLIYTGKVQTPIFRNFNSKFMATEGVVKATSPGTYTTIFKLIDSNVEWKDGTTNNWNVSWIIERTDIRNHEDVTEIPIKYNEYKQLITDDGKTTYDRVGYVQTGWVEDCEDTLAPHETLYDRVCSYNKFTSLKTGSYATKEACEAADNVWYSNKCYSKKNLFDIGSTVTGMFVANKTNSCEVLQGLGGIVSEYTDKNACMANGFVWWNNECHSSSTAVKDTLKDDSYDLYAVWSPVIYRIQYDTCDDKGCGELRGNPKTMVSYEETFHVQPPKRLGYEFTGWTITGMDDTPHTLGYDVLDVLEFTTPEAWAKETLAFKNLHSVEDMTVKFTANWTPISYTVSYDWNVNNDGFMTDWGDASHKYSYRDENNNHTTAVPYGTTYEQIQKYDIPFKLSENHFVLPGYTFVGWNTRPDGRGNMVSAETVATITNAQLYNRGTFQVFVDQLAGVKNLSNLELLDQHIAYHADPGEDPIDTLNDVVREKVTLYAQWTPNTNTKLTIRYWKQKPYPINWSGADINASYNNHNTSNYTLVGSEVYSGVTDTNVKITPYNYDKTGTSVITNHIISKKFSSNNDTRNLKSANQIVATISDLTKRNNNNGNIKFVKTSDAKIKDDLFYGYTPELTNNSTITNGNGSTWNKGFAKDSADGSIPSGEYTYTILPNGERVIDIYYRRNKYIIDYSTIGGTITNPNVRLYQSPVTLADPADGSLQSPSGSDGGSNNSGLGNFIDWYRTSNLTGEVVNGIDGEVGTREHLYAKWLQYRYTLNTNGWSQWKRQENN